MGQLAYKTPHRIREATIADIPTFVEMGERLHRESNVSRHRFNPMLVATFVAPFIQRHDRLCLLDNHKKGCFMGMLCNYAFADATFAREEYWYIKPEYRHNGRLAMRFYNAFVDWARRKGADDLFIGTSTGIDVDRTHKLMTKLKFHHVGGFSRRPEDV